MNIEKTQKKIFAFTLAEVLIALVILGIVLSVTLPILQRIFPSTEKVMIRKVSLVSKNNVAKMLANPTIYPTDDGFANTTATTASGGYNKFCYYFKDLLKQSDSSLNCPLASSTGTTSHFAKTIDNVDWYLYSSGVGFDAINKSYLTKLVIDVNGVAKPPNCLVITAGSTCTDLTPTGYTCHSDTTTCKVPDTFVIGVRYDGKLRFNNTEDSNNNNSVNQAHIISILSDSEDVRKD